MTDPEPKVPITDGISRAAGLHLSLKSDPQFVAQALMILQEQGLRASRRHSLKRDHHHLAPIQGPIDVTVIYHGIQYEGGLNLIRDSPSVKVTVGKEPGVTYSLPKTLLTFHSPFFAATLDGTFAEAISGTVSLPEDLPSTFKMFLHWLYIDRVTYKENSGSEYAKAWILGDKLGCLAFRDHTMVILIHIHSTKEYIKPLTMCVGYETHAESKLRRWAMNRFIIDVSSPKTGEEYEIQSNASGWKEVARTNPDFPSDFMNAMVSLAGIRLCDPEENTNGYLDVLRYDDEVKKLPFIQ